MFIMPEPKKFETKKSLGQHFLTSDVVPKWMCDAANISPDDTVLEIGPGTGVLTEQLLFRGARVIALEADVRAIDVLTKRFKNEVQSGALIVHHVDMRDFDITSIPELTDHGFKIVANIPYYLSGMLFRIFLQSAVQPSLLVYLVQKEVARRITSDISRGEKESILALSIKVYGEVTYVKTVTKGHFTPPPKIDSAIVLVAHISKQQFATVDEAFFFKMLHIGFGQKRKQLLGNLSKYFDRNALTHTFSTLSLPVSTRAEDVPLQKWLELVRELQSTLQSTPSEQL